MHEIQLKTLNVCSFQTRYVCIRKHNFLFCTLQLYSSCFKVVLLHLFTNIFVLGGSRKRAMWYAVWAVSTAGKWRSHRKVRVLNEYWRRLAAIPWIWCTTQHSTHHAKWMHFAGIRADDGVLALPNFLTFKADFREANDQIVHYLLQNQWKNFHFWRFANESVFRNGFFRTVLCIDALIPVLCNLLGACHSLVSAHLRIWSINQNKFTPCNFLIFRQNQIP